MGMAIHSRLKQEQKLAACTPVLDVQLVVPCLMKWPTPSWQINTNSLIDRHLSLKGRPGEKEGQNH